MPTLYAQMDIEKKFEESNQFIASRWRLINYNLDSFFSNNLYDPEKNQSNISVYLTSFKKEGKKIENEVDFRARLHLPEISKNLRLVIEKDQDEIKKAMTDENITADSENLKTVSPTPSERYSAALTYLLKSTADFNSAVKFGLRFEMPLNPSIKTNINKLLLYDYFSLELAQNFILYRQEGFSEISSVNISRSWNKDLRTDLVNSLAWTNETAHFILRNNFLLYYNLSDSKALAYSLAANAKLSPVLHYDSYDTSLNYRQRIKENWLFASIGVGAEFIKMNNFSMEKFIQARLEIHFK